jgi:hypothetical protein
MLAEGGVTMSDLAVLREQPDLLRPVASTLRRGGSSTSRRVFRFLKAVYREH